MGYSSILASSVQAIRSSPDGISRVLHSVASFCHTSAPHPSRLLPRHGHFCADTRATFCTVCYAMSHQSRTLCHVSLPELPLEDVHCVTWFCAQWTGSRTIMSPQPGEHTGQNELRRLPPRRTARNGMVAPADPLLRYDSPAVIDDPPSQATTSARYYSRLYRECASLATRFHRLGVSYSRSSQPYCSGSLSPMPSAYRRCPAASLSAAIPSRFSRHRVIPISHREMPPTQPY